MRMIIPALNLIVKVRKSIKMVRQNPPEVNRKKAAFLKNKCVTMRPQKMIIFSIFYISLYLEPETFRH